jgi:hypothetical protein
MPSMSWLVLSLLEVVFLTTIGDILLTSSSGGLGLGEENHQIQVW